MNSVTDRELFDAVAVALEIAQRCGKRADNTGVTEARRPAVDHDDLLALLERSRPRHGNLRALLRRTYPMGQAALGEKTRKQADIGISISGAQDATEL